MTEWEVVGVIIALVGLVIAIGAPVLKLNTSITRLIAQLNNLDEGLDELTARNAKSHERLWRHNDEQDKTLKEHEKRIIVLEEKEK